MKVQKLFFLPIIVLLSNNVISQQQVKNMSHLNCDSSFVAQSKIEFKIQPDSAAEFSGGKTEFYKYLSQLKLRETVENHHGIYYISIVVEANGEISLACVLRPINPYPHGETLIEFVQSMPKWKPATKNGKNIKSLYSFPIRFCVGR